LREGAVEMVGIVLELQSEATGASFVPDKALSNAVTIFRKFNRGRAHLLIDPLMARLTDELDDLWRQIVIPANHKNEWRRLKDQEDRTGMQTAIDAAQLQ